MKNVTLGNGDIITVGSHTSCMQKNILLSNGDKITAASIGDMVTIIKNEKRVLTFNCYEMDGFLSLDDYLVVVGHDDDVYLINLITLKKVHERFR